MFEGYGAEQSRVIVEVYTDNVNRTAPEIRVLFRKASLVPQAATNFSSITLVSWRLYHPMRILIAKLPPSKRARMISNRSRISKTTTYRQKRQARVSHL